MNTIFGIIYKCTNLVNNKMYIGMTTKTLEHRIFHHLHRAKNSTYYIYNALNKYGKDNFVWEVIQNCYSKTELIESEKYYISHFRTYVGFPDCNGYNMTLGGEFGNTIEKHPDREAIIKKISIRTKEAHQRPEVKAKVIMNNKLHAQDRHIKSLLQKSKTGYIGEEKSFIVICNTCNNAFEVVELEGLHPLKEVYFCCKNCSSSYAASKRTDEGKENVKNALRGNTFNIGRKATNRTKNKMSISRSGSGNSHAKTYTLISPTGKEVILTGEFTKFIKEQKLSKTLLLNNIGLVITQDMMYRNHKTSINTIGWKLISVN